MNNGNSDNDRDDDHRPVDLRSDDNGGDMTLAMSDKPASESTTGTPEDVAADMPDIKTSMESSIETDKELFDDAYDDDVFEIGIPIGDSPPPKLQRDADGSEAASSFEAEPISDEEALRATDAGPASEGDVLLAIKTQMEELSAAFDSKLKYDEHKNKIIDDLHQNLQQHREGLLKKYLHRIVMDVIKVVDDMRKLTAHYNQQSPSDETSLKLLKYIENIASDLEDMFSWEGVLPFTCDGDAVDPARQRVLNKIETNDPEKDKTIAERLRPGYEWDGKIIRPEMVSAYIYQTNSPSGD